MAKRATDAVTTDGNDLKAGNILARAVRPLLPRLTGLGLLSLLAVGTTAVTMTGCMAPAEPPFDPRTVQREERDHADALSPKLTTLPTTLLATTPLRTSATSRPGGPPTSRPLTIPVGGLTGADAPTVRLALREVIQRAVANSSEVRVAGYDPAINAQRVIEEKAKFDPIVYANAKAERQSSQSSGQQITSAFGTLTSLYTQRSNIYSFEAGFKQMLPAGGQAQIGYSISETDLDPPLFRQQINPFWENQLKLQVTQPLLRNFGGDVNNARIRIAQNDQRISMLDFRKALEDNTSELEKDYWQLVQAEREVRIAEELLTRTTETYTTLYNRWVKGIDASKVPVSQAESSVKARQAILIAAQQRVRDVSSDIKRRMNDPEFPVSGPTVLLASDAPLSEPIDFDLKDQIYTALENRLELGQQQHRIGSASVALEVARNALLPKLDLVAQVAAQGLSNTEQSAFENQTDFNHISYSVGFEFEYPIGDREAKAVRRRAQLQRLQAIEQYRNLVGQISLDVELAWNEIYSDWRQGVSRQQSRLASQEQLTLIQAQEDAGAPLTPSFVQIKLQAQEELATAQREESNAITSYNIAIQRLEKSKGTLLRYNNVVMEEDRTMQLFTGGHR